jgi:5-methylcytosine-specific restriction endonuclease McrA
MSEAKHLFVACVVCSAPKVTKRAMSKSMCQKCSCGTASTRLKRSEAAKKAWNDEDIRERMIESQKLSFDDERREKRREDQSQRWEDPTYRSTQTEKIKGTLSSSTHRIRASLDRGGDGDLERLKRGQRRKWPGIRGWRQRVKERDGFKCQRCGSDHHLHAHHIKRKAEFPDLCLELENGITLCESCHSDEHPWMKSKVIV